MLQNWWKRPINFTTRSPRNDAELDEYVFLDKHTYAEKLVRGDFLEVTNYGGNWYWVSTSIPEWDVCVILDWIGREQVHQKVINGILEKYELFFVYMNISEEVQKERLLKRWDSSEEVIKRKKDFEWFFPSPKSVIMNWEEDTSIVYEKLCEILKRT